MPHWPVSAILQYRAFLAAMAPHVWASETFIRVGTLEADQLESIGRIFDLDDLAALIQKHLVGNSVDPHRLQDQGNPVNRLLAERFISLYNKQKKESDQGAGNAKGNPAAQDSQLLDEDCGGGRS